MIIRGVAKEKHRAQLDHSGCFVSCDSVVWKKVEMASSLPVLVSFRTFMTLYGSGHTVPSEGSGRNVSVWAGIMVNYIMHN